MTAVSKHISFPLFLVQISFIHKLSWLNLLVCLSSFNGRKTCFFYWHFEITSFLIKLLYFFKSQYLILSLILTSLIKGTSLLIIQIVAKGASEFSEYFLAMGLWNNEKAVLFYTISMPSWPNLTYTAWKIMQIVTI